MTIKESKYAPVATHAQEDHPTEPTSTVPMAHYVVPEEATAHVVAEPVSKPEEPSYLSNRVLTSTQAQPLSVLEAPADGIPNFMPAYLKVQGPVAIPDNMKSERKGGLLLMERKWKWDEGACGLLCFATFWNGFMITWNCIAIFSGTFEMAMLGFIHDAVGLWLAYTVAQIYLNTTYIRVTRHEVTVDHRPLNHCKEPEVTSLLGIREICCKREVQRGDKKDTITFEVHAVDRNTGDHKKILTNLPRVEEALFVEQEIEKLLGLTQEVHEEDGELVVEGKVV